MASADELTEYREALDSDPKLSMCKTREELEAKLKALSGELEAQDADDSPFKKIAFEGKILNPAFAPNVFKPHRGQDGNPITSYYRYAVKDEAHAAKAAASLNKGPASLIVKRGSDAQPAQSRSSGVGQTSSSFARASVKSIIASVAENNSDLTTVNLSGQATFQMKSDEKVNELCDALKNNTSVKSLSLKDCAITDAGASRIGEMLSTNSSITELDLASNTFKEEGAVALANGIASNKTLREMNLMNMLMLGKSEKVLRAFIDMYESNITLKKIIWRLDHPLANTLARLMTRNNTIDRRINQGKPFADLLPEALRASHGSNAPESIPENNAAEQPMASEEPAPQAEDTTATTPTTEPETKEEEKKVEVVPEEESASAPPTPPEPSPEEDAPPPTTATEEEDAPPPTPAEEDAPPPTTATEEEDAPPPKPTEEDAPPPTTTEEDAPPPTASDDAPPPTPEAEETPAETEEATPAPEQDSTPAEE